MTMTSEKIDDRRRRLLSAAAAAVATAAAQLGMLPAATAQPAKASLPRIKPGTNVVFGPLKQIDAGPLNVAYAESGPAEGPPVILLHGWPYDIRSFVDVTPLHRPATGCSFPICGVTARRAFSRTKPSAMASPPRWPRM